MSVQHLNLRVRLLLRYGPVLVGPDPAGLDAAPTLCYHLLVACRRIAHLTKVLARDVDQLFDSVSLNVLLDLRAVGRAAERTAAKICLTKQSLRSNFSAASRGAHDRLPRVDRSTSSTTRRSASGIARSGVCPTRDGLVTAEHRVPEEARCQRQAVLCSIPTENYGACGPPSGHAAIVITARFPTVYTGGSANSSSKTARSWSLLDAATACSTCSRNSSIML